MKLSAYSIYVQLLKSSEFGEFLTFVWQFQFQVEEGMESLRQKLEMKYDLQRKTDTDINCHDNETMTTDVSNVSTKDEAEKESDGYCSGMKSPRTRYNKLALDVDSMVKGVQRLKEFQEQRYIPAGKDVELFRVEVSPKKLDDGFHSNEECRNKLEEFMVPITDIGRVFSKPAGKDELKKETYAQDMNSAAPIRMPASYPATTNDVLSETDYVDNIAKNTSTGPFVPTNPSINFSFTIEKTLASAASPFLIVLTVTMVFIICIVTVLVPESCNVSLPHQRGTRHQFMQLSWSDGIPPM